MKLIASWNLILFRKRLILGEIMTNNRIKLTKSSVLLFPILLTLYEVTLYLSNDAYLPALPYIAHDLHSSFYLVELTLTTWFMGLASMQLILGPIADRIGRRQVLLFGGVIFIILTLACALVQNITTLLILRFFQGATITSMVVAGYATIHELFDREQAIHTLALMNSIVILAPAFGPLFGAFILYFASWRWIFTVLAIGSILSIYGLFFHMPETQKDIINKATLNKNNFTQYKDIIVNKSFMLYTFIYQFLLGGLIAWITAGPIIVIEQFHFKPFVFSIVQAFIFGSFIVCIQLVKQLMKVISTKTIIMIGIILTSCGGLYLLISSIIWPEIVWNTVIAMMFFASGSGFAFPILNRLAVESSNAPMDPELQYGHL